MSSNIPSALFALTTCLGFFAVSVQAAEPVAGQQESVAERCIDTAGLKDARAIKEMARELSPDVILDKVFSAVAPDFQKAILSRPSTPDKPVRKPEALREQKYFLPAIAIMDMPFNWIRVRANGQVIEPSADAAKTDPDWERLGKAQQKQALPESQRY